MANIKDQQPRDENGRQHGEWIERYNNGQIWYRVNFVHGIEHGLGKGYYSDGRLRYCGYYNMGREIGYWYYYYKPNEYYLWII